MKKYIAAITILAVYATMPNTALAAEQQVETPTFWTYYHEYETNIVDDRDSYGVIKCATDGAEIFYTLDGSIPDKTSERYPDDFHFSISLDTDIIIKAIAYKDGMQPSEMATLTYKKLLGTPNSWAKTTHRYLGDGYKYYDNEGKLVRDDWVFWNGNWYYFNEYFMMSDILLGNADSTSFYLRTDGKMARGWEKIKNAQGEYNWHYFRPDTGKSLPRGGGWLQISGKYYMFGNDGIMLSGWVRGGKYGDKWLYLDEVNGDLKTGWFKEKIIWYYANNSGYMQIGWVKWMNNWYYLDANGAMVTGVHTINGKRYQFDDNGAML